MPRQVDHKHAFGPRALKSLSRAFEDAWREVGSQIPQETTSEQIELTRTKLAQWVINYLGASSRWSASCQLQT